MQIRLENSQYFIVYSSGSQYCAAKARESVGFHSEQTQQQQIFTDLFHVYRKTEENRFCSVKMKACRLQSLSDTQLRGTSLQQTCSLFYTVVSPKLHPLIMVLIHTDTIVKCFYVLRYTSLEVSTTMQCR